MTKPIPLWVGILVQNSSSKLKTKEPSLLHYLQSSEFTVFLLED